MSDIYPTQKGYFKHYLYEMMKNNKKIWVISMDLGYKIFDEHFKSFPERCINTGAAEEAAMGIATGLALEGKIPFVFSITNFVLYRPFEWLRNYIDNEKIPVKLIAGGRDDEYKEDGYTHQSCDAKKVLEALPNIVTYWPETKEEIPDIMKDLVSNNKPCFLSLRRKA